MENKIKRYFFLFSLLFKSVICFLLTVNFFIDKLYIFSLIYVLINLVLVLTFIFDKEVKFLFIIITSVLFDVVYSLIINFLFSKDIESVFYFYPGTVSLYYIGVNLFFQNNIINYIIFCYGFILIFHMIYLMREKINLFNVSFLSLFFFIISTIGLKIFYKE